MITMITRFLRFPGGKSRALTLSYDDGKEQDRRLAAYYQFYTDLKWGASKNYHISLNSGTLGIDQCVEVLANLY